MNPFRLSFPYGATNALAAGEELRVFLTPDVPGELWSSGDPAVLQIVHRDGGHYLIGLRPGAAPVLIDGLPVGEPISVVDLTRPRHLYIYPRLGHNRSRCEVIANYVPYYSRDVTADPAVQWHTSSTLILGLVPTDPGLLVTHADGPARIWVAFHGLEAHVDLDCTGGIVSQLGDMSADALDFLAAGIVMPLSIQIDRSCDAGNRDDSCVTLEAHPPEAVRIERIDSQWHVTGLRPGLVTLEAAVGAIRSRRQFEIRSLPIEISRISIHGGYLVGDVQHVFQEESHEITVRLSAPGYSYIRAKPNLRWTSTDESIARVDTSGAAPQLIAGAAGSAVIRAECAGTVVEWPVVVSEPPEIQWF